MGGLEAWRLGGFVLVWVPRVDKRNAQHGKKGDSGSPGLRETSQLGKYMRYITQAQWAGQVHALLVH